MAPSATKHFVITAAGIDIGFYSTKFTYGESLSHTGTQILADQFPSLAPQMAHKRLPHLPTSAALDGAIVSIDKVDYCRGPVCRRHLQCAIADTGGSKDRPFAATIRKTEAALQTADSFTMTRRA